MTRELVSEPQVVQAKKRGHDPAAHALDPSIAAILGLQQSAGNSVVARVVAEGAPARGLARKGDGWSDARSGGWNEKMRRVGKTERIPLEGLSGGLADDDKHKSSSEGRGPQGDRDRSGRRRLVEARRGAPALPRLRLRLPRVDREEPGDAGRRGARRRGIGDRAAARLDRQEHGRDPAARDGQLVVLRRRSRNLRRRGLQEDARPFRALHCPHARADRRLRAQRRRGRGDLVGKGPPGESGRRRGAVAGRVTALPLRRDQRHRRARQREEPARRVARRGRQDPRRRRPARRGARR